MMPAHLATLSTWELDGMVLFVWTEILKIFGARAGGAFAKRDGHPPRDQRRSPKMLTVEISWAERFTGKIQAA
jgi:hypothetical protein